MILRVHYVEYIWLMWNYNFFHSTHSSKSLLRVRKRSSCCPFILLLSPVLNFTLTNCEWGLNNFSHSHCIINEWIPCLVLRIHFWRDIWTFFNMIQLQIKFPDKKTLNLQPEWIPGNSNNNFRKRTIFAFSPSNQIWLVNKISIKIDINEEFDIAGIANSQLFQVPVE